MQEDQPDATATAEAPQGPEAPKEETPVETGDATTLTLSGPFWTTAFRTTSPSGDTLVIDRQGTSVPTADVNKIMADATAHGVTLTRKAN